MPKSYSQKKRAKMDYRAEYFAHNPGLFGVIWTCAYCHRPLIGRHNVVIDHIVPLNSPFGQNARYNLVASCSKCNLNKSDKVDGRIVKGYVSKAIEIIVFSTQKVFLIAFVGAWTVIVWLWNGLMSLLKMPFINTSIKFKIVALIVYGVVLYMLLQVIQ